MRVLVAADMDAGGCGVRRAGSQRRVFGDEKIDQVMRLQSPDVPIRPTPDSSPAIIVMAALEAVEVSLRVEIDGGKQPAALAMVDVHAHMASATEIRAQVAVVAIVTPTHVDRALRLVQPRLRFLRANSHRSILDGQACILSGHTLQIPFLRIPNGNQIEHVFHNIRPDSHTIHHVRLVETLLAAGETSQCHELAIGSHSAVKPIDNPARFDPLDDLGRGAFEHKRPRLTISKREPQRITPIHFQRSDRVLRRQLDHLACSHRAVQAAEQSQRGEDESQRHRRENPRENQTNPRANN